jgi:hypothetical protein
MQQRARRSTQPLDRAMTLRVLSNALSLLVAVLGGIFFGLFSCGGHSWHGTAFFALLGICTAAALYFPVSPGRPLAARVGLVLLIFFGYLTSRAAAAAFYPSAPESWSEFSSRFAASWFHGSC